MTEHEALINIIVPFVWLIIPLVALGAFYKIRTSYKVEQMKQQGKVDKKEQTLSGGITKMLNDAPKQLQQINSEIATLEEKCLRERIPPEKKNELLKRLYSERDMLQYAVKYGDIAKPFLKPLDRIVGGLLKNIGQ